MIELKIEEFGNRGLTSADFFKVDFLLGYLKRYFSRQCRSSLCRICKYILAPYCIT